MNKDKIVIFFLLVAIITYSQNKFQGRVVYTISISMEKVDLDKIKKDTSKEKEVRNIVVSIFKNTSDIDATLNFTKNEALYELSNEMKNEFENKINLTSIMAKKGLFYTNLITDDILHQTNFMGDLFLVQYKPIRWKLLQETKKIGNYICYKATTAKIIENKKGKSTRVITAWYTPQIPVSFGPKEYHGLPGLILELQEDKLTFLVTKIELNPKGLIRIKKPTKGKKVTEEKYSKIIKEATIGVFGKN